MKDVSFFLHQDKVIVDDLDKRDFIVGARYYGTFRVVENTQCISLTANTIYSQKIPKNILKDVLNLFPTGNYLECINCDLKKKSGFKFSCMSGNDNKNRVYEILKNRQPVVVE